MSRRSDTTSSHSNTSRQFYETGCTLHREFQLLINLAKKYAFINNTQT